MTGPGEPEPTRDPFWNRPPDPPKTWPDVVSTLVSGFFLAAMVLGVAWLVTR